MTGGETDASRLKRAAARLRKRFQALKDQLRASVREAGARRGGDA